MIEKDKIENIKIGDILHTSWGYDQTNHDYCIVVGKTKKSLLCQMVGMKIVKVIEPMVEEVVPNPEYAYGKKFRVYQRSYSFGESWRHYFVGSYPYCEGSDSKRKGSWSIWDGKNNLKTSYH